MIFLLLRYGATTGKTYFCDDDFPFEQAVINEHIFKCKPVEFINPKYLFYFIISPLGQKNIQKNVKVLRKVG